MKQYYGLGEVSFHYWGGCLPGYITMVTCGRVYRKVYKPENSITGHKQYWVEI